MSFLQQQKSVSEMSRRGTANPMVCGAPPHTVVVIDWRWHFSLGRPPPVTGVDGSARTFWEILHVFEIYICWCVASEVRRKRESFVFPHFFCHIILLCKGM